MMTEANTIKIIWVIIWGFVFWILTTKIKKYSCGELGNLRLFIDERRILKHKDFLELLIYELEIAKSNTIKNLNVVTNKHQYKICESQFLYVLNKYGIYIIKQAQYNANNKWEIFTLCILQTFLTLSLSKITDTQDIVVGIITLGVITLFVLFNNPLNKTSFILTMNSFQNIYFYILECYYKNKFLEQIMNISYLIYPLVC